MSQWTASRKFRNAKGTVSISVCALIQSHPFVAAATNGNVTDILATGGLLPRNDEERDEAARLMEYVRNKYIGRVKSDFENAREIVMGHNIKVEKKQPGITIVNTIEAPSITSPEAARRIAERIRNTVAESIRRPLYENKCRARFDNVENFKGVENVPDKRFFDAPTLGTYWREKARNKDYQVIGVSEHENYVTVRMQRTTSDGVFDFPFHSKELWLREFEQCYRMHDEFYTDPYAAVADHFKDVPYSAQRVSLEALRPERRYFIVPAGAGKTDVEAILKAYRDTYPDITAYWNRRMASMLGEPWIDPRKEDEVDRITRRAGFKSEPGHELPPAEGERYQSLIMGRNIYRVLDARRKLNSEDWYITMIRECDGHKAKFTYRDHATWFLVWVPVIDEEEQHKPEVRVDVSGVTDGLKKVGEAMHEAAASTSGFNTGYTLGRIERELDKHVPNWRLQNASGPEVSFGDLMIRAIRSLNKHMHNYQNIAEKLGEHNAAQLRMIESKNKQLAKTRVVPAVGSVWRTNSTGTYATVTHVFAESGMAKMRSAKGAEYDLPLDRLFEYSTLAVGPASLLGAIGEVQCNAYGMTQDETKLKDIMAGSVLHVREIQHSSTGDVTVSGFLHAKKPKEG